MKKDENFNLLKFKKRWADFTIPQPYHKPYPNFNSKPNRKLSLKPNAQPDPQLKPKTNPSPNLSPNSKTHPKSKSEPNPKP